jgi:hypothetical protein
VEKDNCLVMAATIARAGGKGRGAAAKNAAPGFAPFEILPPEALGLGARRQKDPKASANMTVIAAKA